MSDTRMKDLDPLAGCAVAGLIIVLCVPAAVLDAWVLRHLWAWFVTPTFGLPVPGLAVLVGLSTMVGLLTHQSTQARDERTVTEQLGAFFAWSFVSPLIALAVGYVAWRLS